MDFSAISSVNSFAKTFQLQKNVQQKLKTPGFAGQAKSFGALPSGLIPKNQQSAEKTAGILYKLQSGQDLSAAELEYLRQHAPESYNAAVRTMQEKKAYEEALYRCESKEEVQALQMGKVAEALSTIKGAIERNDLGAALAAHAKLNAFSRILTEFTATAEYREMADTYGELAEERSDAAKELAGTEDAEAVQEPEVEAPQPEETREEQPQEEPVAKVEQTPPEEAAAPGEKDKQPGEKTIRELDWPGKHRAGPRPAAVGEGAAFLGSRPGHRQVSGAYRQAAAHTGPAKTRWKPPKAGGEAATEKPRIKPALRPMARGHTGVARPGFDKTI